MAYNSGESHSHADMSWIEIGAIFFCSLALELSRYELRVERKAEMEVRTSKLLSVKSFKPLPKLTNI